MDTNGKAAFCAAFKISDCLNAFENRTHTCNAALCLGISTHSLKRVNTLSMASFFLFSKNSIDFLTHNDTICGDTTSTPKVNNFSLLPILAPKT